ncbi:MAG: YCF48-related protein [Candidatus Thiodiazotropha sp.]
MRVSPMSHEYFNLSQRYLGRCLGLVLLAGTHFPLALAQGDALEEASIPSALVARSLLLDIDLVGSKLIAVGERGHVILSRDKAANWSQSQVPVRVTLTASFFIDEQQGWVVGHDGVVLRTRDGGHNWTKQLDGNQVNYLMRDHAKKVLAEMEAALEAATEDELEALQIKVDNFTVVYEDAESFISEGPSRPFLDVWFKDAQNGFIVGAFGLILRTHDGGDSWTPWFDKLDNTDGFHLNAIRPIANVLYIAAEAGRLYRSDDWGQNWILLDSPYEGTFFGLVEAGEGGLLAYGLRGNAFLSMDQGVSWKAVSTGTDASLSGGVRLEDGSVILVGASGTLLHLSAQGVLIQGTQTPYKLPLSAVLQTDSQLLAVGFGGIQPLALMNKPEGVRP